MLEFMVMAQGRNSRAVEIAQGTEAVKYISKPLYD